MSKTFYCVQHIIMSKTLFVPAKYCVHAYRKVYLFTFHMPTCKVVSCCPCEAPLLWCCKICLNQYVSVLILMTIWKRLFNYIHDIVPCCCEPILFLLQLDEKKTQNWKNMLCIIWSNSIYCRSITATVCNNN